MERHIILNKGRGHGTEVQDIRTDRGDSSDERRLEHDVGHPSVHGHRHGGTIVLADEPAELHCELDVHAIVDDAFHRIAACYELHMTTHHGM